MKQRDAMVYPLVAVDVWDLEEYARSYVEARFPSHTYAEIVATEPQGGNVLLKVRMVRKEQA